MFYCNVKRAGDNITYIISYVKQRNTGRKHLMLTVTFQWQNYESCLFSPLFSKSPTKNRNSIYNQKNMFLMPYGRTSLKAICT